MPARMFYRFLSVAVLVVSGSFTVLALKQNQAVDPDLKLDALKYLPFLGVLSVLVAFVVPLRIGFGKLMIPLEIRNMLRTLGVGMWIGGLSAIAFAFLVQPNQKAAVLFLISLSLAEVSLASFLKLSFKLPKSFQMSEMLVILKSAKLFGKPEESIADREFKRWSGGRTAGVSLKEVPPDAMLYDLKGKEIQLSQYFRDKTPLVLNIGSYSCPHHRKRLPELKKLQSNWQEKGVRFLTVYIAEAHPEDGWKLAGQYQQDAEYSGDEADFCFMQAKNVEERIEMVRLFQERKSFKMEVVIDSMKNACLKEYNAWPIRLYIIYENKVAYTGEQGPFGYEPTALNAVLKKLML